MTLRDFSSAESISILRKKMWVQMSAIFFSLPIEKKSLKKKSLFAQIEIQVRVNTLVWLLGDGVAAQHLMASSKHGECKFLAAISLRIELFFCLSHSFFFFFNSFRLTLFSGGTAGD